MTLRAEERRALLALQTGRMKVRPAAIIDQGFYLRTDFPAGLTGREGVVAVRALERAGLAHYQGAHAWDAWAATTETGTEFARGLVRALGDEVQQLLREMASGREMVLRQAQGGAYWQHPAKAGGERPTSLGRADAGNPVDKAARLGLLVVAGSRALLTGAGEWAAAQMEEEAGND